jgi:P-type Cu+ transporter
MPQQPAIDPVCGMKVDPARSAGEVSHRGTTYYFCSKGCAAKFTADPEKYLSGTREAMGPPPVMQIGGLKSASRQAPAASRQPPTTSQQAPITGEWVCPMHPEVVSDRPGPCPKCGMALEPRVAALDDAPNPEMADMSRRLLIGVALGAPVFVLAMADMVTSGAVTHRIGPTLVNWVELALSTPVVFWCGWPFFDRMWASFKNVSPNMFTLIGIGVGAAYVYSAAATIAPGVFPAGFRMEGAVATYFDTTVVITDLVLLGQVLELRARHRTGEAIRHLLGLAPKTARVVRGHLEVDIPLAEVVVGDLLRVRPGERVPVDGVVTEGEASVDESMISGEPMPVDKHPADPVIGATMAATGTFIMRAERVGADTLLAQIVRMVGEAQRTRAPIQRVADRIAAYFVPGVVITAILTFAAWSVWGPQPRFALALVNAVAVLIIACPCALGLATPMSIMVGTGEGARAGVLIKNAEALELVDRIDTLVVDKTGTLTEGRPRVAGVFAPGRWSGDELLRLAASVERGSEHPLGSALLAAASDRGLRLSPASGFVSTTGHGVAATVDGHQVAVGKGAGGLFQAEADPRRAQGETILIVTIDAEAAGFIAVADPVRASTPDAIRRLHEDGLRIVMLTGDNRRTAEAIAARLHIDDVRADVLPAQKRDVIRELQAGGRFVAMAGDGINDAPALAEAAVGIAMGTGTDVAIESAGITLVKADLGGIVRARALSHATLRNIRQNLFLAFVYNTVGVPIAAGVLYPFAGVLVSPMWASAAMTLSSLSVIANALRLRRVRLP